MSIGKSGNEYLINKVDKGVQYFGEYVMDGICEGLHENLFDKYKVYEDYECRLSLHKSGIYKKELFDSISLYGVDEIDVVEAEIEGICSRKNMIEVKLFLQDLIDNNNIPEHIECIYEGLIHGGHFELFVWFNTKYEYLCRENDLVKELIIKNDYQLFTYILLNCIFNLHEGKKKRIVRETWYDIEDIDYISLVKCCIKYRRIEMLTFLITTITFTPTRYNEFLRRAELLRFDDIANLLISNSHLFEKYNEYAF
jgi:hypothetical protein